MLHRALLATLALLLTALPLSAQRQEETRAPADSVQSLDLPDAVANAVVDFFNDPRRLRYSGPAHVEAADTVRRDMAVLQGPLTVAGHIAGSAVLVNGDVVLLPGASVTGDLLVVGGRVTGAEQARVGGEILVYPQRLRFRREGERIVRDRSQIATGGQREGRSDFLLATGRSYNRVEGLPITFGPRVQTAGSNPLRLTALGIYRTEAGLTLSTERMGYYVSAEQMLGGRAEWGVGLTAHSLVDPIEEWHLSDLENGLATFVFHQDFRDHYQREGVSAFARWTPRGGPLALRAEVRRERHSSLPARDPWSLLDDDDAWRPQPLVAEGRLSTATVQATLDTRSHLPDPSTGWYLRARLEHALDSDLHTPAHTPEVEPFTTTGSDRAVQRFTTGMVDLRRYNRVDPVSRLNLRLLAAGSLDGAPLPPQRQHALGGAGSLPGLRLFHIDCGARDRQVRRADADDATPFFPNYGCDGFALLQAEYRGNLHLRLGWGAPWDDDSQEPVDEEEEAGDGHRDGGTWGWGWDFSPDWAVFVDAARGWAWGRDRDSDLAVDAGFGLLLDRLGVYLAAPLSGGGSGLKLLIRLSPRF